LDDKRANGPVWVAKVVGFLADYQLSAHFAPGIVHADFNGYLGSIFDPFLFRARRCHFLQRTACTPVALSGI
jgi:hypothetical protein